MRIVIADDHAIVRSGLKYMVTELGEAVDVVEANTFDQAWEACTGETPPELAVIDLHMPGFTGLDDIARLVKRMAPRPVVIFSMLENPEEMRAVLATGVRGFIPKSTDDALVVSILRLVMAGGTYVPPVLGGIGDGGQTRPVAAAAAPAPPPPDSPLAQLTRRQQEVLSLLAEGLSNQEISDRLGLNLSTVKTHVTGILKALGVDNRTQAVLALKRGARGQA